MSALGEKIGSRGGKIYRSCRHCGRPVNKPDRQTCTSKECYRDRVRKDVRAASKASLVGNYTSTSPCCGSRTADVICCLYDPRELKPGDKRRLPGDWCLWCGESCKEGQSFCSRPCGIEYANDAIETKNEARFAAKKVS